MRMRAFKSHGMNRVIARGVSHAVNDISRSMSRNERLKNEVYSYSDDDSFYETFSKFPRSEIKNRYILQRLHEIEMKRNGVTEDNSWFVVVFIVSILFLIIFLMIVAISNI